jgi:hypothetical protein
VATRIVYVIFLLPVISSIIFGSLVLNGILIDKPERELNMWQVGSSFALSSDVELIGLEKQYTTSQPIEIEVKINDSIFDCGDLYITIYDVNLSPKQAVTQGGFFQQCFTTNNSILPVNDEFSEVVKVPGNYEIVIQMIDKNGKNNISSSAKFTVK